MRRKSGRCSTVWVPVSRTSQTSRFNRSNNAIGSAVRRSFGTTIGIEYSRDDVRRHAPKDQPGVSERRQRLVPVPAADVRKDPLVEHALHQLLVDGLSALDASFQSLGADASGSHQPRGEPEDERIARAV